MNKVEFETIEFRAAKEIFEIYCSAVLDCRRRKKKPSKSLLKKRNDAAKKFSKFIQEGYIVIIDATVPFDCFGFQNLDKPVRARALIVTEEEARRMGLDDDDEDDED